MVTWLGQLAAASVPNKKPRIEGEHDPGSRKEGYPHRQDG